VVKFFSTEAIANEVVLTNSLLAVSISCIALTSRLQAATCRFYFAVYWDAQDSWKGQHLPLKLTKTVLRQVTNQLAALHTARVVHSHINLENVLFNGNFDNQQFAIVDFDLSTGIGTSSKGGTRSCVAPEVFLDRYTSQPSRDIFALRVLAFVLLASGVPVFSEGKIVNCPDEVPDDFKALVDWIVAEDLNLRPTAFHLLEIMERSFGLFFRNRQRTKTKRELIGESSM